MQRSFGGPSFFLEQLPVDVFRSELLPRLSVVTKIVLLFVSKRFYQEIRLPTKFWYSKEVVQSLVHLQQHQDPEAEQNLHHWFVEKLKVPLFFGQTNQSFTFENAFFKEHLVWCPANDTCNGGEMLPIPIHRTVQQLRLKIAARCYHPPHKVPEFTCCLRSYVTYILCRCTLQKKSQPMNTTLSYVTN